MIDEGHTGHLFEPGDATALAGILSRLAEAPEAVVAMRSACLERAHHFTAARFVDDYEALYTDILSARRSVAATAS